MEDGLVWEKGFSLFVQVPAGLPSNIHEYTLIGSAWSTSQLRVAPPSLADHPNYTAAAKLGNGSAVTASDTVPFALWCAARHLSSYEDALWATVSGLGDRDTTCAIVGGIVVMYVGVEGIPAEWREHREQIPSWVSSF